MISVINLTNTTDMQKKNTTTKEQRQKELERQNELLQNMTPEELKKWNKKMNTTIRKSRKPKITSPDEDETKMPEQISIATYIPDKEGRILELNNIDAEAIAKKKAEKQKKRQEEQRAIKASIKEQDPNISSPKIGKEAIELIKTLKLNPIKQKRSFLSWLRGKPKSHGRKEKVSTEKQTSTPKKKKTTLWGSFKRRIGR